VHTANALAPTNLTWNPLPFVDIVVEVLAGGRVNKDGQRASSSQIQSGQCSAHARSAIRSALNSTCAAETHMTVAMPRPNDATPYGVSDTANPALLAISPAIAVA